jgi:hypothetical protein
MDINVKNICISVHLCICLFEMFVHVSVLILLRFLILVSGILRSITFIHKLCIEMPTFLPFDSFTPHQLYTNVTDLVSCCITLARFPVDGPLRTITCRSVKCDL